jgi:4-alpha-glucanotransferase
VAGVPPDYFSETGQLWGNPLYDWSRMATAGYAWWVQRLRHALALADAIRLDHFRGFQSYWEVPAGAATAAEGRWVPGPGRGFFETLRAALGGLPLVAEDLGEITEDVITLRKAVGLPGMAILQFGFPAQPRSTFIPYALERDLVVYTGTHDNNTTAGWYSDDADEEERDLVRRYVGSDGSEIHWDMVRLAMASVADLAIVPHQDLAGLGSDCRMNTPGLADGNWEFRILPWTLKDEIQERLADLIWVYGRRPMADDS